MIDFLNEPPFWFGPAVVVIALAAVAWMFRGAVVAERATRRQGANLDNIRGARS